MTDFIIFGGTGSLGQAVAKLLPHDDVTIISRCENRQKEMAKKYPGFKYILGDITSPDYSIWPKDATTVMNFAAQKHVEIAEVNPAYSTSVNYAGAINISRYAELVGAAYHVFTSTDKAVLPINTYGASKLLAERYMFSRWCKHTVHSVFRWGNILGSTGSVLQIFADSLLEKQTAYVTDLNMTRFWATIENVASFLTENYQFPSKDKALIPPMKASRVISLVDAVAEHLGIDDYEIKETGIRDGEKIDECLETSHDGCLRSDTAEQYTKEELVAMVGQVLDGNG